MKVGGRQGYGGGRRQFWLTSWGRNESIGSKMTPRLQIWVEGVTMEPSMLSVKSWVWWVIESRPMIKISDLLQLSFRKCLCIHVLMPVRHVERVE